MYATTRTALVGVIAALTPLTLFAAAADAAPTNAPNRLAGTADCGSVGVFSFVVNSGNAQNRTWNPAFAIRETDGARAVFHPASVDLTTTTPFGVETEIAAKPGAPGPVACAVTGSPAGFPEATLTGTVTGTLTWLG